jgi:hypothetical protein
MPAIPAMKEEETRELRPQAKRSMRPYLKNKLKQKALEVWLKRRP